MTKEEKAKELAQTIHGDALTQLRAYEALIEMAQWAEKHLVIPYTPTDEDYEETLNQTF